MRLPLCLEPGQEGCFLEKVSSAYNNIQHSRKPSEHHRFNGDLQLPVTPASRAGPARFYHPSQVTCGPPWIVPEGEGREGNPRARLSAFNVTFATSTT